MILRYKVRRKSATNYKLTKKMDLIEKNIDKNSETTETLNLLSMICNLVLYMYF